MNRYAWGVTLTATERKEIAQQDIHSTQIVRIHDGAVTLPDGTVCPFTYHYHERHHHHYVFGSPLHQSVWDTQMPEGGVPDIEEKAQRLVVRALILAQQEERRQMYSKIAPPGRSLERSAVRPPLSVKAAAACAGKYAVCVRFASGRLMRLGPLHEDPGEVVAEIRAGCHPDSQLRPGQQIVIGIGCRWARCWQEARFLLERVCLLPPEPTATETPETACSDGDTPEPQAPTCPMKVTSEKKRRKLTKAASVPQTPV